MDIKKAITDTLKENYMPYAMSVIVSRAIPEIDGFKPSHRKILYTMYKMGLLKGARTKSSNVVGQTMKLNPHGDQAIYDTLVRLSKGNESLLYPLIDSKGNFGKIYSKYMKSAAPRYTEIKLADIANEFFKTIDKDAVEFIDNYDGTTKEPVLLPVTFPNILANPNQGIAVGMASNICSFNLTELCNYTIAKIDNVNCSVTDHIKGPDFSTGGQIIFDEKEFERIVDTGRGALKVRSKYHYDKDNNCIEIYEIPYTTTIEAIIDKIIALVKANKIKEITDVRDETDLKGLKITIDIKKNSNPDDLMNKLFKLTSLQDTFNANFNILIDKRPVTLGLVTIVDEWIKFRRKTILREINYDITKKSERLHLLLGLKKILLDIDLAIKIIRETEKEKDVIPNLMNGFDIDEIQAEFIADIKLRNINKEFILKRIKDVEKLQKEIDDLNGILKSKTRQNNFIKKGLKDVIKKYDQPRKSEIIFADNIVTISHEDLIEDYNAEIFVTKFNFLKKIPLKSLRSSGEQKLKDKDVIVISHNITNKDELLFFTNFGNLYKIKAHEIDDSKASDFGLHAKHLLSMEDDESIVFVTTANEYLGFLLIGFSAGRVAKIPMDLYETKQNRKKLVSAYNRKNKYIFFERYYEDIDIALKSNTKKVVVFNSSIIIPKNKRDTIGDKVITLKKGESVTFFKELSKTSLRKSEIYRVFNIPVSGITQGMF